MAINFPNAPPLDSQFSAGDRTWVWNGTYWEAISTTVGYSGSQGNLGYTGSAGAGFTGSAGTQGSAGFTGSIGSTGTQGSAGFTGSAGSTGTQGNVGFTGSIGSTGTQGSAGFTGSAGSTGTQGNIGFTGSIGYTGSRGIDGVTTTTTIAATIVGTTSTTAGIPGFADKSYTGSLNDGYTLTNGDLYVWKGGESPGSTATIVEYLIVAGGGAGGYGGGGGGGVLTTSGYVVAAGSPVSLSVGDGGVGATNPGNSTFASFTAIGGGRGGSVGGGPGAAGGSGGGASYDYGNAAAGGGAGTAGQGNRGGHGSSGGGDASAGGGGGAGGIGTGGYANGTNLASGTTGAGGGAGGIGLLSSISGTPTYYGGGGGGGGNINGANIGNAAPGGLGGGGNGATTAGMPNQAGTDGTPNTGGGGGGGDPEVGSANFKRGGSGIVIIRYADSYPAASATTGSPTVVTTGGYRIYSWTTVGSGSITFASSAPTTGPGWVLVGNIKGIPGEYAAIGYTGSAGTNGYTGSAGSTGTQGEVGFTGSAGSTGTQGSAGFTGSAGIGFTGYSGSAGFTGSAGIGFTGYSGSAGFTGSAGAGYTGSAGSTGTQGDTGFTGSAGSTGTQGNTGFTGSVGAGYAGSTGYTGSKGESSFTWGDTLPSSPVVGDRWYDTSNSKLVVYVNDGDSTQWVEVAASGFLGQSGYTGSAGAGSTGPKISSVTVTDSSYNTLDDTAVALTGGYIKIAGSGFESGCQVLLGTTLATSVSYISSTEVRAQLPAASTGTYIIYLVNSDGGTAIRVNAVTFSPTPSWTTGAALSGTSDTAISIQLAATDATSYTLAAGSSLPSGVTLSSSGLLSGTITGLSADTAYNFTIVATDVELQDSTRAFTFTITVGDTYFKYTTLLLAGNGTNNSQNNTFIDSSTNNFTVTRYGNTTQGTFSPYGPNWSNYFDGTGDVLTPPANNVFAFGTGAFCIEAWIFNNGLKNYSCLVTTRPDNSNYSDAYHIGWDSAGGCSLYVNSTPTTGAPGGTITAGQWQHFVCCRDSSNRTAIFVNGVRVGSDTVTNNFTRNLLGIGDFPTTQAECINGYISNLRLVKGSSVYDPTQTTITVPTSPLTTTSQGVTASTVSILTCQSNRFIDNSTNAFAITVFGNTNIQRYSPFSPTAAYSTSTIGGSGLFDGTGDNLQLTYSSTMAAGTGPYSFEAWVYFTSSGNNQGVIGTTSDGFAGFEKGVTNWAYFYGTAGATTTTPVVSNQWNHVVVCRNGSNAGAFFVNGTRIATFTDNANKANFGNLQIGYNGVAGGGYTTGNISDYRYVKGNPYDPTLSTLTVPTSPLTAVDNTVALLNYTNAGIIDNSMMTNLETVGDAKITTAVSKFGSGSLVFDGAGDYLISSPNAQVLNAFGTGDFTVEFWMNSISFANADNIKIVFDCRPLSTDGLYPCIYFFSGQIRYYVSSADRITGSTLNTGQWYHVALSRSGSSTKLFVDGTQVGSTYTDTNNYLCGANRPVIASRGHTLGENNYNGYLDDLRITKGLARYTATFTPPTSAHPLK